jgi:hypothetical protein
VAILVLSGRDNAPLSNAVIEYACVSEGLNSHHLTTTGADGRAQLNARGKGSIAVKASGHAGVSGTVVFDPGEYTVLLAPTGAIEMEVVDERGLPIPDVEVELFPFPIATPNQVAAETSVGELSSGPHLLSKEVLWLQKTGRDGRIQWLEVAPGEGYRWLVRSKHFVKGLQPTDKVVPMEGGLAFVTDPSSALSTPALTVLPGSTTKHKVEIVTSSSVRGAVAMGEGTGRIELATRVDHVYGSRALANYQSESVASIRPPGKFEFAPATPGKKRIKTWWKESPNRFRFIRREFELLPGEHKDLGLIAPDAGYQVEGIVRIEGAENLPAKWSGKPLIAVVTFANTPPPPVPPEALLSDILEVNVGESFTLEGLMEGSLAIGAGLDLDNSPHPLVRIPAGTVATQQLLPGLNLKNAATKSYPIPQTRAVEMLIQVTAMLSVRISANISSLPTRGGLRACLLPDPPSFGPVKSAEMELGASGEASATLSVPPGDYKVWAFSSTPDHNYFGETSLKVGIDQPNEARVNLGNGAIIKGALPTNKSSFPLGGASFGFHVEPYSGAAIYKFQVNAQGQFTLTGVAPNCILRAAFYKKRVQAGGPGVETVVQFE